MIDGSRINTGSLFHLESTEKRHILILAVTAAALLIYSFMGQRLLYMTGISGPPLYGTYRDDALTLALNRDGNLVSATRASTLSGTWRVLHGEHLAWQPDNAMVPQQTCRYGFSTFNTLRIDGCGIDGTYERVR